MSLISIGLLGVIYSYWVYDDNIITYGNLSLAVGIFGTLIGLYDAFAAIESIGNSSIISSGISSPNSQPFSSDDFIFISATISPALGSTGN